MTHAPDLHPKTCYAMAKDDYLSEPAEDNPLWQGAANNSRSFYHEEWGYCVHHMTETVEAIHQGGVWYRSERGGEWVIMGGGDPWPESEAGS